MSLRLPLTGFSRRQFLQVPWFSPAEHGSPSPGFASNRPEVALYMPFHGDYIGSEASPAEMDQLRKITGTEIYDRWLAARQAAVSAGDCPFWGPSAFEQLSKPDQVVFIPINQGSWRQSVSAEHGTDKSHLSAALGVGVGASFLGASVTGKYDKTVTSLRNTSKDSLSIHYVDSLMKVDPNNQRSLSSEAMHLLEEAGPEAFQVVFGTHFISGYLLGCESGYLLSMETSQKDERNALSLIVEVHVLFWEASAEMTVTENFESTFQQKLILTSYDTLSRRIDQLEANEMTGANFISTAMTIRDLLQQVENRVAAAKAQVELDISTHGASGAPQLAESHQDPVLEILLSPWTVLDEWHEGCRHWREKEVVHQRPS